METAGLTKSVDHLSGADHQRPSKLKLSQAVKTLLSEDLNIGMVLVDGVERDLTASIKTALEVRYSAHINNVFINSGSDKPVVWIEPKNLLSSEEEKDVRGIVLGVLSAVSAAPHDIQLTQGGKLPTPTAVLNAIRTLAPITSEDLSKQLALRGFDIPNKNWMSRMLDRLRRSGRIIRLKSTGTLALTNKGLTLLGSRKNRRSPDIVRALALAKRGR